jgi:hypothetical protein
LPEKTFLINERYCSWIGEFRLYASEISAYNFGLSFGDKYFCAGLPGDSWITTKTNETTKKRISRDVKILFIIILIYSLFIYSFYIFNQSSNSSNV